MLRGKLGIMNLYDRIAKFYDYSKYLKFTRIFEECEYRVFRSWIDSFKSPILDVGCGSGRISIPLAMMGFEVISLDFSFNMLRQVRNRIRRLGLFNIYIVRADAEYLPFKFNSINTLVCLLTFNHFINPGRVASEFGRVLRVNGRCIISTFNSSFLRLYCRLFGIPINTVLFKVSEDEYILVFEEGFSAYELIKIFREVNCFRIVSIGWCCNLLYILFRYLFNLKLYFIDRLFSLKYSLIHLVYLVKI